MNKISLTSLTVVIISLSSLNLFAAKPTDSKDLFAAVASLAATSVAAEAAEQESKKAALKLERALSNAEKKVVEIKQLETTTATDRAVTAAAVRAAQESRAAFEHVATRNRTIITTEETIQTDDGGTQTVTMAYGYQILKGYSLEVVGNMVVLHGPTVNDGTFTIHKFSE